MSTGHITQLSPMLVYLNVAAPKIKNAITLRSIPGLLGLSVLLLVLLLLGII